MQWRGEALLAQMLPPQVSSPSTSSDQAWQSSSRGPSVSPCEGMKKGHWHTNPPEQSDQQQSETIKHTEQLQWMPNLGQFYFLKQSTWLLRDVCLLLKMIFQKLKCWGSQNYFFVKCGKCPCFFPESWSLKTASYSSATGEVWGIFALNSSLGTLIFFNI